MDNDVILEVSHLRQYFPIRKKHIIKAVDDVSFHIKKGEIFGLVGETGCGKSTVARTIMGMYPVSSGEIRFAGIPISDKKEYQKNKKMIQRRMQIIFQDSAAALDPRMTVEELIAEPLIIQKVYSRKEELREYVLSLMDQVGLAPSYRDKYPSEISGGQRQRTAIARALGIRPDLIIADEPIASLDVSIQAQIVNLFVELQEKHGFSFLFIAHDLSIIRFISNRIGVMRKGRLVEMAETEELFGNPVHPYTRLLLASVPVPDPDHERSRKIMEKQIDHEDMDDMEEIRPGHLVRRFKIDTDDTERYRILREEGNPAKPIGESGAEMLKKMNEGHYDLTGWAMEHFQFQEDDCVLDIGCGGGMTLKRMSQSVGHLTGLDYSETSVEQSRLMNERDIQAGKMEIILASVEKMPFGEDTFDKIITVESFYFWPDHLENLKEVRRVLKPGGMFILAASIYGKEGLDERDLESIQKYDLYNPSLFEFQSLFEQAGFVYIHIYTKKDEDWVCVEAVK